MKKLLTLLLLFCALPLFASEEKKMKAVEMLYQDLKPFIVKLNQDRIVFNYRDICYDQNYHLNSKSFKNYNFKDALKDLKSIVNFFYKLNTPNAGVMGNGLYAGLDPYSYRNFGGAAECSLLSIITLPKDLLILDTLALENYQLSDKTLSALRDNFSCNLFISNITKLFFELVNDKKCINVFKLFVSNFKISGLFYKFSIEQLYNCDYDPHNRTFVLFDSQIITPEKVKFYGKIKAEPIIEKYLKKLSEDNPLLKYEYFNRGKYNDHYNRYFYEDFKETPPLLPEEMDGYYRWHEKMFYCH